MKATTNPSPSTSQGAETDCPPNCLNHVHARGHTRILIKFLIVFTCFTGVFAASKANAEQVEFFISLDDYVEFYVAGQLVASYDAYPWGTVSVTLDLAPGWHDIRLVYRNRWGSNALYFYKKQTDDASHVIVPRLELRSLDSQGRYIEGLRADYGTFIIYGEGPIEHGYPGVYQGQPGSWAGVYDYWALFSEALTGQIFVRSTAPGVTNQPVSQTVAPGDNVSFCVAASGAEPLAYQWRFNGTILDNATNACLFLTNAAYEQAGLYSVQVSNASGTTNSDLAMLSFLDVRMYAGLTLAGPVGTTYRIDCASVIGSTNDWQALTNATLTTSPQMWFDVESRGQARRFYRAAPIE